MPARILPLKPPGDGKGRSSLWPACTRVSQETGFAAYIQPRSRGERRSSPHVLSLRPLFGRISPASVFRARRLPLARTIVFVSPSSDLCCASDLPHAGARGGGSRRGHRRAWPPRSRRPHPAHSGAEAGCHRHRRRGRLLRDPLHPGRPLRSAHLGAGLLSRHRPGLLRRLHRPDHAERRAGDRLRASGGHGDGHRPAHAARAVQLCGHADPRQRSCDLRRRRRRAAPVSRSRCGPDRPGRRRHLALCARRQLHGQPGAHRRHSRGRRGRRLRLRHRLHHRARGPRTLSRPQLRALRHRRRGLGAEPRNAARQRHPAAS